MRRLRDTGRVLAESTSRSGRGCGCGSDWDEENNEKAYAWGAVRILDSGEFVVWCEMREAKQKPELRSNECGVQGMSVFETRLRSNQVPSPGNSGATLPQSSSWHLGTSRTVFVTLLFFFSPKGPSCCLYWPLTRYTNPAKMPLTWYAPLNLCVHMLDAKSSRPVSWPQLARDTIEALTTPLPGWLTIVCYQCLDIPLLRY